MTPQEFEANLRQTLADRRLSGGERQALRQLLESQSLDGQKAAVYRNLAFRLAREAAQDGHATEALDWLEDVVKLLHPVQPAGAARQAEALFAPRDNVTGRIRGLFEQARRTADVCVFTVTDDRITQAMLQAHRRGVRVRVVTDNDKALDLGSDVARLGDAGVPVRIDRTEAHMHHKFAVFDEALLINGSFNWTRSAAEHNAENLLVTADPVLVDAYRREFERLWAALSP
jgi:phosphatidylserine/phosphatidylglycerophosphate/cardiolipin synthase-like enzyme